MKIARCHDGASTFWAQVDLDDRVARPLAGGIADWGPALTADPTAPPPYTGDGVPLSALRLRAPIEPTSEVVAAGATYPKHVDGLGLKMPERPAAFLKGVRTIIGPDDEIAYPAVTEALDYEAELVVVVGAPDRAVLGFTAGNDVSARDLQFAGSVTGMDMFSAKGLDRTSGLGPWIVTHDEFVGDSPDLELSLTVDGERRQHERTSALAWPVPELLAYVDARMRLWPGDVLFTGTPAGVGHETGSYLRPGQEVVVSVEGVGTLRNVVGKRVVETARRAGSR